MTTTLAAIHADVFHRALANYNNGRVAIATPSPLWQQELRTDLDWRLAEGRFLESSRDEVAAMLPDCCTDAEAFIDWFAALVLAGPGQQHPLFDWLADSATLPQMRWFLSQEAAGEVGFEDLLAYTQVRLPAQAKLECARNYWDEMGRGTRGKMHGQMLEYTVRGLGLEPSLDTTIWESLALSNTMLGLAMNRRYAYHALGALGVIELTAPQRVARVSAGMHRLGLDHRLRAYFDLHAALDITHAKAWIQEVIRPLIVADPSCAAFIAEGALMRLLCGQRCFNRYTMELQGGQIDYPVRLRRTS